MVGPSDHVPLEESGTREVQDVSSEEEDILVLDTSRELFGTVTTPVEPLLVNLDDEGNDRVVVVLSDDSMEDSMGGPGFGYVAPDVQEVPPPESPVFRSLDIRERLGRPGESEAMDQHQREVRDRRNAERVRGRHRRATSTTSTTAATITTSTTNSTPSMPTTRPTPRTSTPTRSIPSYTSWRHTTPTTTASRTPISYTTPLPPPTILKQQAHYESPDRPEVTGSGGCF